MSRECLETVLNALVPFAKVELERMGNLPPVAGSVDAEGEVELHMPRADDPGTTEEFLDILRTALRHGARDGRYCATGLCMDVQAQRPDDDSAVDAIAVHLEAQDESLYAFVPYARGADGEITYGEIFYGPADAHAFAGNGHGPS